MGQVLPPSNWWRSIERKRQKMIDKPEVSIVNMWLIIDNYKRMNMGAMGRREDPTCPIVTVRENVFLTVPFSSLKNHSRRRLIPSLRSCPFTQRGIKYWWDSSEHSTHDYLIIWTFIEKLLRSIKRRRKKLYLISLQQPSGNQWYLQPWLSSHLSQVSCLLTREATGIDPGSNAQAQFWACTRLEHYTELPGPEIEEELFPKLNKARNKLYYFHNIVRLNGSSETPESSSFFCNI